MFIFKSLNIRLEKEELSGIYKRGRSCFKREEIQELKKGKGQVRTPEMKCFQAS